MKRCQVIIPVMSGQITVIIGSALCLLCSLSLFQFCAASVVLLNFTVCLKHLVACFPGKVQRSRPSLPLHADSLYVEFLLLFSRLFDSCFRLSERGLWVQTHTTHTHALIVWNFTADRLMGKMCTHTLTHIPLFRFLYRMVPGDRGKAEVCGAKNRETQ